VFLPPDAAGPPVSGAHQQRGRGATCRARLDPIQGLLCRIWRCQPRRLTSAYDCLNALVACHTIDINECALAQFDAAH